MHDESFTEDLVLLHGDVLTEHISGLRGILLSDNIYTVKGPKEHVMPGRVQVIIRISEVIDFHKTSCLTALLHKHCDVFKHISHYFKSLERETDYIGFDLLVDYLMTQFTVLFVSPVNLLEHGLTMLEHDIPELALTQSNGGCIKYFITGESQKTIQDCKVFKDLYSIDEYFA